MQDMRGGKNDGNGSRSREVDDVACCLGVIETSSVF